MYLYKITNVKILIFVIYIIFAQSFAKAELIKPNNGIEPLQVVKILIYI